MLLLVSIVFQFDNKFFLPNLIDTSDICIPPIQTTTTDKESAISNKENINPVLSSVPTLVLPALNGM